MEAKRHRRYNWRDINLSTLFFLLLFVTFNLPYTSDYDVEVENDYPKSPFESWTSPHLFDCRDVSMLTVDSGEFVKTRLQPSFEMNIHSPKDDKWVSGSIKRSGWWEVRHTNLMLHTFQKYPNAYLLDIGGNIGCMTLAAANANQQTITLEPFAPNYERLCRTVNKNSFHDRIHLINAAASDKSQTMLPDLELATGNMGGVKVSSLTDESTRHKKNGVIKAVPIDSLNLPTGIPVVMKLDVEGHELSALVGALGFLEKADLVMAMMELRQPLDKDPRWKTIFRIVHSKGLQPYKFSEGNQFIKVDTNNPSSWSSRHETHFDVVWVNDAMMDEAALS